MTLGEVHLHPSMTIPPAVLLTVVMAWYWRRLGAGDVPDSRRRIRRASIAVTLLTLPILVHAASFLDAEARPGQYVITWLLVMFCIGLVLLTAGLDVLNTMRLSHLHRRQRLERATADLIEASRKNRPRTAPPEQHS